MDGGEAERGIVDPDGPVWSVEAVADRFVGSGGIVDGGELDAWFGGLDENIRSDEGGLA